MSTMRAVTFDRYGPPDVVGVEILPDPEPNDRQVLIRVKMAEVTKADCELRSFRLPVFWYWLPLRVIMGALRPRRRVLGNYFAGEVVACPSYIERFAVGQRVVGCTRFALGAHAELLRLSDTCTIVPIPEKVSFADAAALPLGGLNALHFLNSAKVQRGESVLVNGAGGSIGSFAVQLAKHLGATVTAVDAGHKEQFLRNIGADHFIDYQRVQFLQNTERYDVIFSLVAGTPYNRALSRLRPGGRYIIANPTLLDLLRGQLPSSGRKIRTIVAFAKETEPELEALLALLSVGKIRAPVDRVFPASEAPEAHRRVETEERLGAVLLTF